MLFFLLVLIGHRYPIKHDQQGLDLIMPRQQQNILLHVWKQDKINISKEYGPLGAKALILVEGSFMGQPFCFFTIKRT